MGVILSQCTYISNHHNIHFECLILLFVNYTSIELKLKTNNKTRTVFLCSKGDKGGTGCGRSPQRSY